MSLALSDRGVEQDRQVNWRVFLRSLVDEIDSMASLAERDDMLRGIGGRMAGLLPLPKVSTLSRLQIEVNDALASIGWGHAVLSVNETDRCLMITHHDLPRIGSAGQPPGRWLSALLEGLYEGWLGHQPGGSPDMVARRAQVSSQTDVTHLRYGRA